VPAPDGTAAGKEAQAGKAVIRPVKYRPTRKEELKIF